MRWGGVPIVEKAYSMSENLAVERASAAQTLEYILELCQKAYDLLPDSWLDIEPGCADKWEGRLTKGVALAIKAKALTFAARPLFNSDKSYAQEYNMRADANLKDEFICFGNYDKERYKAAIEANKAFAHFRW